jgi:hypothetical protein
MGWQQQVPRSPTHPLCELCGYDSNTPNTIIILYTTITQVQEPNLKHYWDYNNSKPNSGLHRAWQWQNIICQASLGKIKQFPQKHLGSAKKAHTIEGAMTGRNCKKNQGLQLKSGGAG